MPTNRRFPPPWSIEDNDNCFIVKNSAGQKLANVCYENEPGRRSAAKLLTKDEARRIAANVATNSGASFAVISSASTAAQMIAPSPAGDSASHTGR
jgi:hypothetical protein